MVNKLIKKVPPTVITIGLVLLVIAGVFRFNVFGIRRFVVGS